jgi:hypothetical protein
VQQTLTFRRTVPGQYKVYLGELQNYESEGSLGPEPRFLNVDEFFKAPRNYANQFRAVVPVYYSTVVAGRRGSFRRRPASETVSKILHPSDEAFVLLVIENNFDYWKEIAKEE